jgi:hypothetical protein
MIVFLGKCIQNLYSSIRYTLSGQTRLTSVLAQAAAVSYDSLIISLVIVFVSYMQFALASSIWSILLKI